MTIAEILFDGSFGVLILLTLVQIAPIKINPWSALGKLLGRALNSDVLNDLDSVKTSLKLTQEKLDKHIKIDEEHSADESRSRILRFNTEIMRGQLHTEEDFIDILSEIDKYEEYCQEHPSYPNRRAVNAVEHIDKVYKERLEKNDFLK